MRGVAVLGATLLAAVLWVALSPVAHACSCAGLQTEAEQMAQAAIVIVGRATSVDSSTTPAGPTGESLPYLPGQELTYSFDVVFVHKGEVSNPATITTPSDGAACGFPLELGQLYKLYPYRSEGRDGLYISLCSGNRTATDADLRPWVPPTTEPLAPPPTSPPGSAAIPPPTEAPATTEATTSTEAPPSTVAASPIAPSTSRDEGAQQATMVVNDEGAATGSGTLVAAAFSAAGIGGVAAGLLAVRRRSARPAT